MVNRNIGAATDNKSKAFVLEEALNRKYIRVNDKTLPVPVRDVVTKPHQHSWFDAPIRDPYVDIISKMLDNIVDSPEYGQFTRFKTLTYDQILMRIETQDPIFGTDYNELWWMFQNMYPRFLKKVYNLLIENGIVEDEVEIDELRYHYGDLIRDNRLPRTNTEQEKEDLTTFLICHIVITNNFKDVFSSWMEGYWIFLENRDIKPIISQQIVIPADMSDRILYSVSSPDMYIMSDFGDLFGMPKDTQYLQQIRQALHHIEETYSPSVRTLESSMFREGLVQGYILKMLSESNSSGNQKANTIQMVFSLMKKGVGSRVIEEFQQDLTRKSTIRQYIEHLLTQWWILDNDGHLTSLTIVDQRLQEFLNSCMNRGIQIEMRSNELVSPFKQRIILVNNGEPADTFNSVVREFQGSLGYKAVASNGGMNYNKFSSDNGLIKILDILVRP